MTENKIYTDLASAAKRIWKGSVKKKENTADKDTEEVKPAVADDIDREYENKLLSASGEQSGVQKKIDSFLDKLNQKYDAFLDRLTGENYKDSDYYNSIVSEYESLGREMAYDAAASSAASNSGNFDSFGAANAHRQMISYKNAGEEAARDAYEDEIDRYTKGLGNYASDIVDAYKLLSDSAQKNDSFTLSLLDAYGNYKKLRDNKESANREISSTVNLSKELDKNNVTNRYLTYAKMLSQIYPEYSDEIQKVFFSK